MNGPKRAWRRVQKPLAVVGVAWLTLLALTVLAVLLNRMVPYQPFAVRGAMITHKQARVCPHDPVQVNIDRKFTQPFDSLHLSESWVTANDGRPVETAEGILPPPALDPTGGFQVVDSPLLTRAPSDAGTFRVRVTATAHGSRFGHGLLKAKGQYTFTTDNTITVESCKKGGD